MADFERIETQADLEALAEHLLKQKVVAFDTEADSFYHYFDKTCLVQVATKKRTALIDPLAVGEGGLAPLGPVMASPDIRKIFHAAEYDLFVLKRDYDFEFHNLFDTMISAQLLGYPAIGLAALVERHFGIKLPKDEQRSDWSARPLRDTQLTYAAADVTHLIQLTSILEKELKKAKRLDWAYEDFETLSHRKWPDREFDKLGYLRIKGARALDPKSLSVLREMFLIRDARAREIDRPPFKVLGNRALLEIAERQPGSEKALSNVKGVTDLILRRFGREILDAVERGCAKNHGPIPKKLNGNGPARRRMDKATEKRVGVLKRWRTKRAKELELDPGVLCPNATLENIAFAEPKKGSDLEGLGGVKGWFAKNFGDEIVEALGTDDAS